VTEQPETRSLQIDHRHLAFFFIGAVAVCAVFFALGFVVGRAQALEAALQDTEIAGNATTTQQGGKGRSKSEEEGVSEARDSTGKLNASGVANATDSDYRKDLDFYHAVKDQKVDQNFHPGSRTKNVQSHREKSSSSQNTATIASAKGRPSGYGSLISLQIAAFKSPAEADKLVKTLQARGYPVFVVSPSQEGPSNLIRVQIGPYTSEAEAVQMKTRLQTEGYAAITKK
jgi:cell division protein FtsN